MHFPLQYSAALVDEVFSVYKVRVEGLSVEVDYLITCPIVTHYEETSVAAAEHVMHRKGLQATVAFSLEFRGVNIITCILKIAKLCCVEYCNG